MKKRVQVLLEQTEIKEASYEAKQEGLSLSSYLRNIIIKERRKRILEEENRTTTP